MPPGQRGRSYTRRWILQLPQRWCLARGNSGVDVKSDVSVCVTCGGCIWRSQKRLRRIGTADHRHHARHGLLVGGYLSRAHHMNGIESCSWGCAWWASWRCCGFGCVPGSDGTIGFCQGFGPQLKNWGRFMPGARFAHEEPASTIIVRQHIVPWRLARDFVKIGVDDISIGDRLVIIVGRVANH